MRILLAEDERVISRLIRQVLTAAGHLVTGVQSGTEAIDRLGIEDFDLILLDLNLADGDGFRVVEALPSGTRHAPPVVLMTGDHVFCDSDPRVKQVQAILWKPFDLDDLEQTINRFVA